MIDWVAGYFDSDYWRLAEAEYDEARTATQGHVMIT
jgi:hypothetical protein